MGFSVMAEDDAWLTSGVGDGVEACKKTVFPD